MSKYDIILISIIHQWEFVNNPQDIFHNNRQTEKPIYNYVDSNMPDWAKPTIRKMMSKGYLKGDDEGKLGLTDELLRVFVINDRAGVYGA